MAKVGLNTTLKGKTGHTLYAYQMEGIHTEKSLIYQEDYIKMKLLFDDAGITLFRGTTEYQIKIIFEVGNTTEGSFHLKRENVILPILVTTHELIHERNRIFLRYDKQIGDEEKEEFEFEILMR